MKYFTEETETRDNMHRTAGIKARDDISTILSKNGYKRFDVNVDKADYATSNKMKKLANHFHIRKIWKNALSRLYDGDELVVQFPLVNHSLFLTDLFRKIHDKKHIKITLLIHDVEILRTNMKKNVKMSMKMRNRMEELKLLELCDKMICHNEEMKKKLVSLGFDQRKIEVLQIFDYLTAITVFVVIKFFFAKIEHKSWYPTIAGVLVPVGGLTLGMYLLDPVWEMLFYHRFNEIAGFRDRAMLASLIWCVASMTASGFVTWLLKKIPMVAKIL